MSENKPLESSTEIAERLAQSAGTIEDILRSEEFQNRLPVVDKRRFVLIALNAISRNRQLAQCTKASFFKCVLDLSACNLTPDGRRAHLIPFRNRKNNTLECTLIIDFKGFVELAFRTGRVASIHADVVLENDDFDATQGTDAHLHHRYGRSRGEQLVCAYSFIKLVNGGESFDIMTPEEIERVRKRSKSPSEGPWVTDYFEMAKKSVFRRHQKWLPLLPDEAREAIEAEDEVIETTGEWAGDERPATPKRKSAAEVILEQAPFAPEVEDEGPKGMEP